MVSVLELVAVDRREGTSFLVMVVDQQLELAVGPYEEGLCRGRAGDGRGHGAGAGAVDV